ncbi:MAG: type II secretion system F family protein [Gammaproteobacteria bacterium]
MPQLWRWKGYSSEGHSQGWSVADSVQELTASLPDMLMTEATVEPLLHKTQLSRQAVIQYTQMMAVMANSGLSFNLILEQLLAQTPDTKSRHLLAAITIDLHKGIGLEAAFAARGIFDQTYLAVLKACETSGNTMELLSGLASDLEQQFQLRQKLISAAIYPAILLAAGIGTLLLMAKMVIPSMRSVLGEDSDLPQLTQVIFALSDALVQWSLINILLAMTGGIIVLRLSGLLSLFGRYCHFIPVVKQVIRHMHLARIAGILYTLSNSRIPVSDALDIAQNSVGQPLKAALIRIAGRITKGMELSTACTNEPALPSLWGRLAKSGESVSDYSQPFAMLSKLHQAELEKRITLIVRLSEPCLILFIGGLMALVLLGLYLPVLQIGTNF